MFVITAFCINRSSCEIFGVILLQSIVAVCCQNHGIKLLFLIYAIFTTFSLIEFKIVILKIFNFKNITYKHTYNTHF